MINIIRYTSERKEEWNNFNSNSKNGTFLFNRGYMDYHADRFEDYSLMLYKDAKLVALLPANIVGGTVYSHQGLTYGGIVFAPKYHYEDVQTYLNDINTFLAKNGIKSLVIKAPPYFYANNLAQELNLLIQRNTEIETKTVIGACISTKGFSFPKRCVRKNKLEMYIPVFDTPLVDYWNMLEQNLRERHDSKPVHNLDEIRSLSETFPNNIRLLSLKNKENGNIEAGALLYISNDIVKVQYFASTPEGRNNRVSDVLYYHIINSHKDSFGFIDFGTCEEGDNKINIKLLETKEKFGANSFPIYTHQFSTSRAFIL